MDYEVQVQDVAQRNSRASARAAEAGLRSTQHRDNPREYRMGPCAHAAVVFRDAVPQPDHAIPEGGSSHLLQDEFPELKKRYWGQHMWARGYFCGTVGQVDEETIREYVEHQGNEEEKRFTIVDR